LPHVEDLRPPARGADDAPHPVAELVALLLGDRAPVGGHVVHVLGPVVPDDVDELVDVHLVVHSAGNTSSASRSTRGRHRSRVAGVMMRCRAPASTSSCSRSTTSGTVPATATLATIASKSCW